MKQFIGTKIIKAKEMNLGDYNHFRGWKIPANEDPEREGYLVEYEDNYVSWSPKETFEEAYRECEHMNFGLALEACKKGKKIKRLGWNGKEQYVILGSDFSYFTSEGVINDSEGGTHIDMGSQALVFVGTRGRQVGWLASQADMLSEDWQII